MPLRCTRVGGHFDVRSVEAGPEQVVHSGVPRSSGARRSSFHLVFGPASVPARGIARRIDGYLRWAATRSWGVCRVGGFVAPTYQL